jgi:hypothetical protein
MNSEGAPFGSSSFSNEFLNVLIVLKSVSPDSIFEGKPTYAGRTFTGGADFFLKKIFEEFLCLIRGNAESDLHPLSRRSHYWQP